MVDSFNLSLAVTISFFVCFGCLFGGFFAFEEEFGFLISEVSSNVKVGSGHRAPPVVWCWWLSGAVERTVGDGQKPCSLFG